MSTLKHAALALAATGLLSAQAHAGESRVESLPAVPMVAFSQSDVNAMFDQSGKPMQLAELSGQEIKETEGAWAPLILWGFRIATSPAVHRQVLTTFNSSAFMPLAHYGHWMNQQRIQHWPNSRWW